MVWHVQLTGDPTDLDEFAKSYASGPIRVRREAKARFVLETDEFQGGDAAQVRELASRIVAVLNGTAKLLLQSETAIGLGAVVESLLDGRTRTFVTAEPAVGRARALPIGIVVRRTDGTVERFNAADCARQWPSMALHDEDVMTALRLRGAGELDWVGLCRLLDVIEEAVGGPREIAANGWATRLELDSARRTANTRRAVGDAARHGNPKWKPPKTPMPLDRARAIVNHVLWKWLESRVARTNGPPAGSAS